MELVEPRFSLALMVQYRGDCFLGYQKQPVGRTVQGELEKALLAFTGERIKTIAAGRTDTGVHALHQVISFKTSVKREIKSWRKGLAALLPDDIGISQAAEVGTNFNARRSALDRTYKYYLYLSPNRPVLLKGKVAWCYYPLALESMQSCARLLVGQHDFSSFRCSECQSKSGVREILAADLQFNANRNTLVFTIRANSFLHKMVRNIMGCLIHIGKNNLSPEYLVSLLEQKNRKNAPPTAPPEGLYLSEVNYPEKIFNSVICDDLFI